MCRRTRSSWYPRPRLGAALLGLAALWLSALPAFASITGPDVSSWQHPHGASIDWNQVKAAGHSFAFIKATESTGYTNPYFSGDWATLAAAGMDRGAYHYADPSQPAFDQANHFIAVTGNTREPGDLPPVLDLEQTGSLPPTTLVTWTHTFLDRVQALTGRMPIIYSYPSFWTNSMGNTSDFSAAGYPLWLADYTGRATPSFPLPGGWTSWTFWQYTDAAGVPSIAGGVDNSNYCCDFSSLQQLAFGSTTTEAPPAPPLGGTDLYGAELTNTTSKSVELHALAQATHYSGVTLHTSTGFATVVPADWQFQVASFGGDGQPDLFGIHLRNTSSGKVEVHVLSAASGYKNWLLHAATALDAVPVGQFQFQLASLDGDHHADLYAIALNGTGSRTVEVHTLSESSAYRSWVLHSATAFAPVDTTQWQFRVGDRSGQGDLMGISHTATGSGMTEVHILDRSTNYTAFTAHVATPLGHTTDAQFAYLLGDHNNDGIPDIYAVAMKGTNSGKTEVHVLSGASIYHSWAEHAVSGLGPTTADTWQFSAH
ncbi:MAG: glycoside hydrolase family 25 protein [Candidatus Dormibacteria bacterium]